MRLSHRDYDALLRAILDLHDRAAAGCLPTEAPALLAKLIPSEYFAIFDAEIEPRRPAMRLTRAWETAPLLTDEFSLRMSHFFPGHPFTRAAAQSPLPSALRMSDFLSMRQLREQPFYCELYRHVGIDRSLAIGFPGARGVTFFSASRRARERDFSERERLLMTLVMPHFQQARRSAEGPRDDAMAAARRSAGPALTPREREVATWLARGKTNPEIAVILHSRPRTVEKHVERILEKLGVENRTAAALVLRGPGAS